MGLSSHADAEYPQQQTMLASDVASIRVLAIMEEAELRSKEQKKVEQKYSSEATITTSKAADLE
jgi:hypothetical protein